MKAPLRILHLEDSARDAALVEACLRSEGLSCEVLTIDSREAYVTALDRGGFDLILADYSLASFDALSALRIAKEKWPETPFILISGALGDEAAVECLKLGATDYVLRQNLSRLAPCIQRALKEAEDLQASTLVEAQMPLQFAALKAAVNAIVITDRQGHIVWVNPAFSKLSGYSSQEAIGRTPRLLKSGKHNQRFYEDLWRTIISGEVWSGEMINRRKDGTFYIEEQSITPVRDDDGKNSHFIAIKQDITTRRKAEEALRERIRLAEFTAEISRALATEDDLRPMLQKCAEAAVQHLEVAFARIWTLNLREDVLDLRASAGMYTHIDGGHSRIPVGESIIGLIALERRPHVTNAVVGDPRVNDQEWAKREDMVGFAGYPLLVDQQLVGVIAMFTREPIPAAIFDTMASGANQIAVGIERKGAEQRAREHFNRIRALHEIDRAITSTLDFQSVIGVILGCVTQYFPRAAAVGIALRDHSTGALEPVACRGMVLAEWKRAFFTGDSFINAGALLGPLVIADLRADPHVLPVQREFVEKTGHESLLVVPIQIDDRILGIMGFATIIKYNFSSNEIEFLSTLAGQAAVAIQNAELYQETKKQQLLLIEQERIQRILKELSQDITKMDVDTLLEKLTSTIRAVFKVDISDVRFLAGGKWANIFVASDQLIERLPDGGDFRHGATDWVLQNRKPIAIHDYLERKEFKPGRVTNMFGVRGFLAAPLLSKSGEVMGVIRALSKEPRTFTPQEIDLFEQLANGAAIAIENERLFVDLQKSDKIKSEFLSVMSHELRTPLNIIMGYAALLKDDMVDDADQDNRSSVVTIETQANELLTMVSSIMQATQIESGATPVHKHQVDVGQLMQELKTLYDAPLDKNLALVWKYPQSLPTLVTDDGILTHILRKLIDNAIKFTEQGTVTVSARVNGSFEFQVSDTGIGIPEESLPIIFDMFKQVDSSSTREFSGAGLGLYIAKKFTELLGGSIEVESAVGEGSTFTIKIPCQQHDTQQIQFR